VIRFSFYMLTYPHTYRHDKVIAISASLYYIIGTDNKNKVKTIEPMY